MNYRETLKKIDCIVKTYKIGLLTITETIKLMFDTIHEYYNGCAAIDINTRIDMEKRLYKHGMKALLKAIN